MMRTRRGSNALEFAVALPIYLVVLAGTLEMGWFFNQQMTVTMVGRDAARAGSLTLVGEDPVQEGQAHATQDLADAGLTGDVACALRGADPDMRLACTVDVPYSGLIGLTPLPGTVHAESVMRLEEQR